MPYTSQRSILSNLFLCLGVVGLVACGDGSGTAGVEADDDGTASMRIGGQSWEAEDAEAEINGSRLKIDASRTDVADGNVSRQQLVLVIEDYQGPGEYEAGGPSMFVGVGIDTEKAKQAQSDEGARETAASLLGASKSYYMDGAQVTITAADDDAIDGTFRYVPPERIDRPEMTGEFHAVLED